MPGAADLPIESAVGFEQALIAKRLVEKHLAVLADFGRSDHAVEQVAELRIEAASGASAGALNAAMLVQGLATGGPVRAKYLLEALWRRIAMASGSPDMDLACLVPDLLNSVMAPAVDAIRRAA